MKIIKIFVLIIVALVSIVLVVAAISPSDYALKKEIVISKNNVQVFEYIKYLKNQENYSTWAKMDPAMKKEYKGTDGTVGFIASWQSENKKVGKGEQEILKIAEGQRIDMELRFYEPFAATDSAYMITDVVSENETKVTWGFVGHISYPMNILLLTMDMEKELGVPLQQGLENLKTLLES